MIPYKIFEQIQDLQIKAAIELSRESQQAVTELQDRYGWPWKLFGKQEIEWSKLCKRLESHVEKAKEQENER